MKKLGFILSILLASVSQESMAQLSTGVGGAAAVGANALTTNTNVGIGTTAPSQKLYVKSSATNDGIKVENTGTGGALLYLHNSAASGKNWGIFSTGSANSNLGGAGNFSIFDMSGGGNRFLIQGSTGNVGIGTVNTSSKLNVSGGISLTSPTLAEIKANLQNTNNEFNIQAGSSGTDGAYISLRAIGNATRPGTVSLISSGAPDGSQGIEFMNYNGGSWVTNAVLTKEGRLGLGSNSPLAKLHIEGIALPNTAQVPTLLVKASNSDAARFIPDGSGNPSVAISDPSGYPGIIIRNNSNRADVRFTGGELEFVAGIGTGGVAVTNGMRLTNSGKLVIGDVTPNTAAMYRLYVQDGILTEKVKVAVRTSTQWADYVFAPDYHLTPLSEVESYVKENKHLPNVPSADEVVKEGIDMATMDAKLLEKIEELTLYIIQMEHRIAGLESEKNATLKQCQE